MSKKRPDNLSKPQLLEQIRQLEEKVHALQGGGPAPQVHTEGLAAGIAVALGKMVPGLGKLIDTAAQTPEFQERLAGIDEEIKRRFKDQPLRQASLGITGNTSRRRLGIPPAVRRTGTGRPASRGVGQGRSTGQTAARGKYSEPRPPKVHISPETPAQLPADVFDEGAKIVILAEAPGLNLEHITVSLEGGALVLAVAAPHRKGVQRIELPCAVTGKPQTSLTNGILNIQLRKAEQP